MANRHLKALQNSLARPLLVSKKENLLYLTGRSFIDGYLLVTKKQAVFLGNGLEKPEKSNGLKADDVSNITKYLKKNSILSVEDDLKLAELAYFKRKLKSVKLRQNPKEKHIESMRLVKSRAELESMRRAYQITAWVF